MFPDLNNTTDLPDYPELRRKANYHGRHLQDFGSEKGDAYLPLDCLNWLQKFADKYALY